MMETWHEGFIISRFITDIWTTVLMFAKMIFLPYAFVLKRIFYFDMVNVILYWLLICL